MLSLYCAKHNTIINHSHNLINIIEIENIGINKIQNSPSELAQYKKGYILKACCHFAC